MPRNRDLAIFLLGQVVTLAAVALHWAWTPSPFATLISPRGEWAQEIELSAWYWAPGGQWQQRTAVYRREAVYHDGEPTKIVDKRTVRPRVSPP